MERYPLPHVRDSWGHVQQLLRAPVVSTADLGKLLLKLRVAAIMETEMATPDEFDAPSLAMAISEMTPKAQGGGGGAGAAGGGAEAAGGGAAAAAGAPSFVQDFDFFGCVLPYIQTVALRLPELFPSGSLPLLTQYTTGTLSLSREQCACLLAHAFFGTLPALEKLSAQVSADSPTGVLNFFELHVMYARVGIERIKCLLAYFHVLAQSVRERGRGEGGGEGPDSSSSSSSSNKSSRPLPRLLQGQVVFERFCDTTARDEDYWQSLTDMPVTRQVAAVSAVKKVEDSDADCVVDFANHDLMIGEMIPSATQEEVLFSLRSELLVSLIFCQRMADNEVIVMRGARAYCRYTGYLDSFRFAGLEDMESQLYDDADLDAGAGVSASSAAGAADAAAAAAAAAAGEGGGCARGAGHASVGVPSILALDALPSFGDGQFSAPSILRDLNKALIGFTAPRARKISTGCWGCGAFGGDNLLKFLQQVMAATVAGVTLDYSTFGKDVLCLHLQEVLQSIDEGRLTVGDLFEIISSDRPEFVRGKGFADHVKGSIRQRACD